MILFKVPKMELKHKNAKNIKKYFRNKKKCIDKREKKVYNGLINKKTFGGNINYGKKGCSCKNNTH